MIEKVDGQVQKVCQLKDHYVKCEYQLKEMLKVMFELRETMRQCESEVRSHPCERPQPAIVLA